MQADSKNNHLKLTLTDDGIHLNDSILWFDAYQNRELSFISSAETCPKPLQNKIIATEETVRVIEALSSKPNALVCQHHRPFSLGKLRLEILPSGASLGGASLFVEKDNESLFYAPLLQMTKIPYESKAYLKPADVLVLHAAYPEAMDNINRDSEINRLLQCVSYEKEDLPIIFCESTSTAIEINYHLLNKGIQTYVHKSYAEIQKAYGLSSIKAENFTSWKSKKSRVILLPATRSLIKHASTEARSRPKFLIKSGLTTNAFLDDFFLSKDIFSVNATSTLPELIQVIQMIKPKSVYLFGTYAMRYSQCLKEKFHGIKPLYLADQPPLL